MTERRGVDSGREDKVGMFFASLRPTAIKGVRLTEKERAVLLARIEQLRVEVENAAEYHGVLEP